MNYDASDGENEEPEIQVTGKYKDFLLSEEKLSGIILDRITKIILDKNTPEIFSKELLLCQISQLKLNNIIKSEAINFLRKGNLERFQ